MVITIEFGWKVKKISNLNCNGKIFNEREPPSHNPCITEQETQVIPLFLYWNADYCSVIVWYLISIFRSQINLHVEHISCISDLDHVGSDMDLCQFCTKSLLKPKLNWGLLCQKYLGQGWIITSHSLLLSVFTYRYPRYLHVSGIWVFSCFLYKPKYTLDGIW